jgi:hypothetical protein
MDDRSSFDLGPRPARRYLRATHGFTCSDEWLRLHARAGEIEHLSLPHGRLLFSKASLDAFFERIHVGAQAS